MYHPTTRRLSSTHTAQASSHRTTYNIRRTGMHMLRPCSNHLQPKHTQSFWNTCKQTTGPFVLSRCSKGTSQARSRGACTAGAWAVKPLRSWVRGMAAPGYQQRSGAGNVLNVHRQQPRAEIDTQIDRQTHNPEAIMYSARDVDSGGVCGKRLSSCPSVGMIPTQLLSC